MIGVENRNGELANGGCCGGEKGVGRGQECGAVECKTYFKVCLKEYQVEVMTSGPCSYGTASSPVLGGNSIRLDGFSNNRNKGNSVGTLIIPFQFAWPVSLSSIRLHVDLCGNVSVYLSVVFSFFFKCMNVNVSSVTMPLKTRENLQMLKYPQ